MTSYDNGTGDVRWRRPADPGQAWRADGDTLYLTESSGGYLQPGRAWIAPGDYHLITVRDGTQVRLLTHQDPPENSCRPAADVLFRSAARTFGSVRGRLAASAGLKSSASRSLTKLTVIASK